MSIVILKFHQAFFGQPSITDHMASRLAYAAKKGECSWRSRIPQQLGHRNSEFSREKWWIFPVRYVKLPEGTVKGEHP